MPGLGYEDLEIGEGATASAILEALLTAPEALSAAERKRLRKELFRYCERDTLGMVKMYEALQRVA